MLKVPFLSLVVVTAMTVVGCAGPDNGGDEPNADVSEPSPVAPAPIHLTIADASGVVVELPGVSWTPSSELPGLAFTAPAGDIVTGLLGSEDASLSDPCQQYSWAQIAVSGSDVGNSDPVSLVGAFVSSSTTIEDSNVYGNVTAREFSSSADARLWLDGFLSTAQACPTTDSFGTDYGMGLNTITAADRELSSGARLVESVAVGESDELGEGTFTAVVAVENLVIVVWVNRHESGEFALEPTSAPDVATFFAGVLN